MTAPAVCHDIHWCSRCDRPFLGAIGERCGTCLQTSADRLRRRHQREDHTAERNRAGLERAEAKRAELIAWAAAHDARVRAQRGGRHVAS